jgi:DHA2 family multidrug resistance protein-like MFS transporter
VVASLVTPVLLGLVRAPLLVAGCAALSGAAFALLALWSGPLSAAALTAVGCAIVAGISALGAS